MDLLSCGPQYSLVTNTVYALPVHKVTLFTDAATPTIVQSNTPAATLSVAVTLTGGMATLAGGFIKVTSAGPTLVTLSRD